ncbi:unnamed protein product [Brassica rapa]|nr:unnamed protein product [Brassica rapa]
MCVSLYEGLAFAFHNKLESYGSEVEVVLVTNIYPKVVGGWCYIGCSKCSKKLQHEISPFAYIVCIVWSCLFQTRLMILFLWLLIWR